MTLIPFSALALPRHLALMGGLAVFSGMIVRVMIAIRVPDFPDPRKAHHVTTPKSGGVGIVCAFLLGVVLLYLYGHASRLADHYFIGVIAAAVLIAAVSLLDDIRSMSYTVKLGGQLLAALVAVASGLWVKDISLPYYGVIDLGWFGALASVCFLMFTTNAMNFIDGLNGLAGGVTLIACLFLAGITGPLGAFFIYTASLLLAGGVLGFMPFNFPKARIFMGDVGSQFCGFMLALFGIAAARFEHIQMSFLLVPFLLSGVFYDVAFTLVRRALARENIARAHNGHLYQVVRRAGMKATYVAMIHWVFVVVGGVTAIIFLNTAPDNRLWIAFIPVIIQIIWTFYVIKRAHDAKMTSWSKSS